jgi:hypothetical protein
VTNYTAGHDYGVRVACDGTNHFVFVEEEGKWTRVALVHTAAVMPCGDKTRNREKR